MLSRLGGLVDGRHRLLCLRRYSASPTTLPSASSQPAMPECQRLAAAVTDTRAKAFWLRSADDWMNVAAASEKHADRRGRDSEAAWRSLPITRQRWGFWLLTACGSAGISATLREPHHSSIRRAPLNCVAFSIAKPSWSATMLCTEIASSPAPITKARYGSGSSFPGRLSRPNIRTAQASTPGWGSLSVLLLWVDPYV
jgi:hypothetical protein